MLRASWKHELTEHEGEAPLLWVNRAVVVAINLGVQRLSVLGRGAACGGKRHELASIYAAVGVAIGG